MSSFFLVGCCVFLITKRDTPKLGPQALGNKRQHGEHICSKHDNAMLLGQRAFLKTIPKSGHVGSRGWAMIGNMRHTNIKSDIGMICSFQNWKPQIKERRP
jgi:hypothetical protein